MIRNILVTYCDEDKNFTFEWLFENEVEEWLEICKDKYTEIDMIKIKVLESIYSSI